MKKLSHKEKPICPCCRGQIYSSGLTKTIGRRVWLWGTIKKLDHKDLMRGRYQWACDDCLNHGRALEGNPEAQLYCDFDPYLAFFDLTNVCLKCNREYIFRKEEQKYWYETLKFWVQSKPNHCPMCRQDRREEKILNMELSTLLKEKEKLTVVDMERLSEIYAEINKPDKSNYYKNLVKKSKR